MNYVFHLPWYFLYKPLHRDRELPEEAFDDRSTFCKLVLHLDVQDVCHQRHERVFLQRGKAKTFSVASCRFQTVCSVVQCSSNRHLSMPDGVGGVGDDG